MRYVIYSRTRLIVCLAYTQNKIGSYFGVRFQTDCMGYGVSDWGKARYVEISNIAEMALRHNSAHLELV